MTVDRWDVRLPDGCVVEATTEAVLRLGGGGKYLASVECHPEHEPTKVELELVGNPQSRRGRILRARTEITSEPLAVAPHDGEPGVGADPDALRALLAPPEVGQHRCWVDRLGIRRQGSVASLDPPYASMLTAQGSMALVPFAWLEPEDVPEEVVRGPERTPEQVAQMLTSVSEMGVKDAISRVYDVLREADPGGDRDGLRSRAVNEVRDAFDRVRKQLDLPAE